MKIRVPKERAYYTASANEPEKLLCWLPPEDLADLVSQGKVQEDILEYYPNGLEVRVSREGLDEFKLDLGATPEELQEAYKSWRKEHGQAESRMVKATILEEMAQSPAKARDLDKFPFASALVAKASEPDMTEGEDPRSVMQRLSG